MASSQSKDELEESIKQYNVQLQQVNLLIQQDITNGKYVQLKNDLMTAISMTNELIAAVISKDLKDKKSHNDSTNDNTNDDDDNDDDGDNDSNNISLLKVGDIVEVSGNDANSRSVYIGILTDINICNGECKVKFYNYDTIATLHTASITKVPMTTHISKEHIKVGYKCKCKYSFDQSYYDCIISNITEHGVVVTYTQYGNSEEVPIQYLRYATSTVSSDTTKTVTSTSHNKAASSSSVAGATAPTVQLFKIPENLTVLPSDTEEERIKKEKKLRAIKSKNRVIEKEVLLNQTQQSWQSFNKKGIKKSMVGISKKSSMFSSSDDVNSKVGVINSGKGVTDYSVRSKHQFNE